MLSPKFFVSIYLGGVCLSSAEKEEFGSQLLVQKRSRGSKLTHDIQFKINLNELLGLFSCLGVERKIPSVSSWVVNKPLEVVTVWKRRFEGWLWGLLLPEMAPYVEPLGPEEEKFL